MRYLLIVFALLFGITTSSCTTPHRHDRVSVSIGINVPLYPHLILVPGHPVYYDPRIDLNYFFYDGLYWVFISDAWYVSSWYNGPWDIVDRYYVPIYLLRVPVRYYRQPPAYFHNWPADAPPRWSERWGHEWEEHHRKSEQSEQRTRPEPAPLPVYQRQYSGDRYPHETEQQRSIRMENYHYQPREAVTQEHFKRRGKGDDERGQKQR